MARNNPLGRLAQTAVDSLMNPMATIGKVSEQAKGSAAFGKMVAEQVAKTAVVTASQAAGAVFERVSSMTGRPATDAAPASPASPASPADLRPVPDVNEPAHSTSRPTVAKPEAPTAKKAANPRASKSAESAKKQGDPMSEVLQQTAPVKKAAPAKKSAAQKPAAKKAAPQRPAVTATPADVAQVVEAAVAEDPTQTGAIPAKKAPGAGSSAASPAASPAKKTPAKKAPAKKTAAKKAPPKTAAQVAEVDGPDVTTPAGTTAADTGTNPDTAEHDLLQPGTEGIVEPSTAKAVASESEILRKAADRNP